MKDQVEQAVSGTNAEDAQDATVADDPTEATQQSEGARAEGEPAAEATADAPAREQSMEGNPARDAGDESLPPDEPLHTDVEVELKAELDTLNDRHLRLAAEFENYRRRMDGELTGAWNRAQAKLLSLLTDALDDLQRVGAFEASNTTVEALIEGVDLVERKILQALVNAGVEIVEPTGEIFDPNTMEAMMRVPAENEEEDDVVQQVFQKGYLLKGVLVRPARVSVLKYD
jgi:molecular chaperone GrpE